MRKTLTMFHPKSILPTILMLFVGLIANAQLSVDFTPDKIGGCAPFIVSFTNNTTGASATAKWYWDFGNGNSSTLKNASSSYYNETTYTITLTVKDGSATSSKTKTITVYKKPTVDFAVQAPKVCFPAAAVFTSTSTAGDGNINTYYWDFGDGNTQQGYSAQINHNYSFPQTSSVGLTVTNSYGCYNTVMKNNIITTLPSISASFTTNKVFLCTPGDSVLFTTTSTGPGTLSYLWDFGDGSSSTQKNPVHIFGKSGAFVAKLTVNSSEGCTVSVSSTTINVDNFVTDFTNPTLICKGGYITFNNISTATPTSSTWTFSNGLGTYSSTGNSSISNYFNQPGSYTLTLQNNFGVCTRTTTKTFVVKDVPLLSGFESILSGQCGAPVVINLKDTCSSSVSWQWSNNYYNSVFATQQSTSISAPSNNSYYVYLTVTNAAGCTASTQKIIYVSPPTIYAGIKNSASPINGSCGPNTITLTASSSTDPIATFNWNMGDGTTSTDAEPVHTFTKAGTNNVTLGYVTKNGCTGSTSLNIPIYSQPVANFTSLSGTTICGYNPVNFSNTTTGPTTYYYWNFGNNNTNSGLTPSVQYQDTGLYTVRLVVINGGCSDTMTKTNYIKVLPAFPSITGFTNTCAGTRGAVTFSQKTKYANNIIWDFGDNSGTVTLKPDSATFIHTYTKTGPYNVSLTAVKDGCNVVANTSVAVLLKQNPSLVLDKSVICSYDQVQATIANYERNPKGTIYLGYYDFNYKFSYGDYSNFTGYSYGTNNSYSTPNIFQGNVTGFQTGKQDFIAVTTSVYFGCNDTTNIAPLKINGAVVNLAVVKDNQCFQTPVVLNGTATSTSTITNWRWNYGDGSVGASPVGGTSLHQYAAPGYYTASLTVTDASNCTSTASATVQVNGPKAAFTTSGTNIPLGTNVTFYNNTNNYNSYNTQYQWTFGDGGTSTAYYPTYTYTTPGTYTIKLIATNPTTGCTDSATQIIVVRNFNSGFNFTSSFVTSSNCPPAIVRFNNTSNGYTSVLWNFGDGITSTVFSPSHIYALPGLYKISLLVNGYNGLTSTYIDSVKINTDTTSITADNFGGCLPQQVKFTAASKITGKYYWDFGDGTIANATDSFYVHNYTSPGNYQPRLLLQNKEGCTTAIDLPNKVITSDGPVISLSPKPAFVCLGSSIQLSVVGGAKYAWSPAGTLNNSGVANPFATPLNNTTYKVTVTDNLGCITTDSLNVVVNMPFVMKVSADTNVCKGASASLNATGANSYQWINNISELSNTNSANTIATPTKDVVYTVVGKDAVGCFADTGYIKIKVIPLPTVNAGPDTETQAGTMVQLNAITSTDVVNWRWDPITYLNCSTCAAPQTTPFAPETYIVYVQNKYGCQASDTVNISLQCFETVFIPSAFTPNGDGKNDLFQIKGNGAFIKSIQIYSRLGNVVFERNNLYLYDRNAAWDGTYNGQQMPAGAYVYFVQLECPTTGSKFVQKGTVLIVR